jgi:acetyl esterase/lipase
MKKSIAVIVLFCLLVALVPVSAQDPEPQRVELTAADGLILVANYYTPAVTDEDSGVPAVLLLHMMNSSKEAWGAFIPLLLDAGYAVLAPDMRGSGETGSGMTGPEAIQDDLDWIAWLREQPGIDPERINVVGGSIGAMLALNVMAQDERIVTAVALSPLYESVEVTTAPAMLTIGERPVFLVAGQRDPDSADAVKQLALLAVGDFQLRIYPHSAHGTGIFMLEEDLAPSIVTWLDLHNH